jgi:DNA-binding transcriptional ArsR family regulator
MNAEEHDQAVSGIAAAIGEPARARILYCLLDGHARTSTELATVAEVAPSTASVHLQRLKGEKLVDVFVQGKHRYYSLSGADVARALEALSTIAAGKRTPFVPSTPSRLVLARTCYDHMAGKVAVLLHDRLRALGWLTKSYALTDAGRRALERLGLDLDAAAAARRRFAYACLDWSERRPHLAGALGAALLEAALKRRWVEQDLDSRALDVTAAGKRELRQRFGLSL